MKSIGLFAYGEMGQSALKALLPSFFIQWIMLPPKNTQSDREKGTEKLARENKIPVYYQNALKDLQQFFQNQKLDAVVIASFNKILPETILEKTTFINVHLGDLPRYRGRANINWAIINGRKDIGVTIHQMIPDLDGGNIYKQKTLQIKNDDTVKTVYDAINDFLEKQLVSVVTKVIDGYKGKPQKGKATYTCTRLPEDGLIDWNASNKEIYNFIRGLTYPYPGAFTYFEGKKMIIWSAELLKKPKVYEGVIPGRIGSIIKDVGVEVLTKKGPILIKEITYEGKKQNASSVIKSVKKTLGINWLALYEQLNK